MAKEDRMRFEDAVLRVLDALGSGAPMTVNEIARRAEANWKTADKVVRFLIGIQDQLTANEVVVLGGANRRIVLLQMRVELSKLPKDVVDWFIGTRFFSQNEGASDEETKLTPASDKGQRVSVEDAVVKILEVLEKKDELSLSSLSRRIGINRRTVARALDLVDRIQSRVVDFTVSKTEDGLIVRRALRSLYDFDDSRMRYVLRKRYLHEETEALPKDQERALLQIA